MTFLRASAALAAAIIGSAASAQPVPPTQPAQPLEYAAKIVCGRSSDDNGRYPVLAGGSYFTAVNVHNPSRRVVVSHKVALATVGVPGEMTDIRTDIRLNYDQAIDFDCRWIAERLRNAGIAVPPFFTGFLVLQSRTPLDVVALYSAGRANEVTTMHTERVPVRNVP
jgi:hypothetical protein